jgi:hypothetical protein
MVDRALTTRQNTSPSTAGDAREARTIRDRLEAFNDELDRRVESSGGTARVLVQVYNGGSMPTVPERIYFTHPVLVTGAETEGVAATMTVDSATTIPVVVLGHAPSVGDFLTAYAVGGRWVTEQLSKTGSNCYSTVCAPCAIPRADLTIAWTNPVGGNGSTTLTYNCNAGTWASGCVDGGQQFLLKCTGGADFFQVTYQTAGVCPGGTRSTCTSTAAAPHKIALTSSVCSPFSLTFDVSGTDCPAVSANGDTQFVITGPNTSIGTCPVCFTVSGCCGGQNVGGATVTVVGVGSVTLGPACSTAIIDVGSPGTYTVTVTGTLCLDYSQSMTLTCGQAVSLNLSPPTSPALDCGCSPCPLPKEDLTITQVPPFAGGPPPFTCDGTIVVHYAGPGLWTGTLTCGISGYAVTLTCLGGGGGYLYTIVGFNDGHDVTASGGLAFPPTTCDALSLVLLGNGPIAGVTFTVTI